MSAHEGTWRPTPNALIRARKILVALLGAEVIALIASGVFLVFYYRPRPASVFRPSRDLNAVVRAAHTVHDIHHVVAELALWTSLLAGVVIGLSARQGRATTRRRLSRLGQVALGGAVFGVAAFGSFTGFLLPWNQLGLWAVTVGSDLRGYEPILGNRVRFVIIGRSAVSNATVARWLFIHSLVLGPLLVVLLFLAWRLAPRPGLLQRAATAVDGLPEREHPAASDISPIDPFEKHT